MDDDLFGLGSERSDDDDLFAAFTSGSDDDDPFASLDSPGEDDLFSGLGGSNDPFSSLIPDEEDEPDLFQPHTDSEPDSPFSAFDEEEEARPAWLSELGGDFDESPAPKKETSAPKRRLKSSGGSEEGLLAQFVGRGPSGYGLGMTAQQRMVLSIFLFLDVTVIGFMLLLVIGAISL